MKILVVGGTGHIGTFLVPKLVKSGHEVYIGTRGNTKLREESAFVGANFIYCDVSREESVLKLKEYRFDVVIDFPGKAYTLWKILGDDVSHIIGCGSLWMFGYPHVIPTPEKTQETCWEAGYQKRYEQFLEMIDKNDGKKAVTTGVMIPNVCGPGKIPLDQYGGRSLAYHRDMQQGKTVYIPDGAESLIGPCDAEDIADFFALAVENREKAANQLFNIGAEYSLTTSQFIKAYGDIYGVDLPIEKVSWEKYITEINPAQGAWWHFYAHMLPDISKAKNLLGYAPKYTPEQTMRRAVEWMKAEKML